MEDFGEIFAWLVVSTPYFLASIVIQIALVAVSSLVRVWESWIEGGGFNIFQLSNRHAVTKIFSVMNKKTKVDIFKEEWNTDI